MTPAVAQGTRRCQGVRGGIGGVISCRAAKERAASRKRAARVWAYSLRGVSAVDVFGDEVEDFYGGVFIDVEGGGDVVVHLVFVFVVVAV